MSSFVQEKFLATWDLGESDNPYISLIGQFVQWVLENEFSVE
mgnify:CR=1 FL=1